MSALAWVAVFAVAVAWFVTEHRSLRVLFVHITRSEAARRVGSLESEIADEFLRDPKRMVSEVAYFTTGSALGVFLSAWIAIEGPFHVAWFLFGVAMAIFGFGAAGARAVYGKARLRWIGWFFGDLVRLSLRRRVRRHS